MAGRRRRVLGVVALVAAAVLAAALVAFEPWRLWTHSTVDEAVPTVPPPATPPGPDPGAPAIPPSTVPSPAPPRALAHGAFVPGEHPTSGTASLLSLADGSRFLRLADFATSDGPDLHVWLTDQPAGGPWGSYDDGRFLPLGMLTATGGNQNYAVPPDADLAGLRSVVIWCDRFNVAFGTAPLAL